MRQQMRELEADLQGMKITTDSVMLVTRKQQQNKEKQERDYKLARIIKTHFGEGADNNQRTTEPNKKLEIVVKVKSIGQYNR